MTTSLDVGSISAWVLDLNENQPSEQKTSGPQDNPSYDNGMEICASAVGWILCEKSELHRDGKSGEVASRRWVCLGQGYRLKKWMEKTDRIREPRGITRNGWKAELRVNYDKLKGKLVNEADLAHAKALRQVGVKVCQFMNYKSDHAGGFHHIGYMGKDMRNRIDAYHRAQIIDTDTEAAIAYLSARVDYDARVYFEYTLDEENRLRNLFWTDTVARYDYEQFEDVLALMQRIRKMHTINLWSHLLV
ncbi:uncharacterized protein LOC112097807 [Citrus clementina]|uniref:uncharacterized protein LOC112097807 n=1 Tax=Citrus clementina TaxID=85681 RepID=UPI000CED6153|nr:uncharacterized protein LOC112097807 [Citrus x clementina]